MSDYADIKIGDRAELKHIISQGDIDAFVNLTGDDNKLHVDDSFAAKTSFKKPVAHGMLSASFISTVIGTKLPGDGALWFSQTLEFMLPVRVGDEIAVVAVVTKKSDKDHSIELRTDIYNQYRQKVTSGTARVKVVDRKSDEAQVNVTSLSSPPVAVVIGASGGIGRAVCRELAAQGFDLVVHSHQNKKNAEDILSDILAIGRKAISVCADIANESQVVQMCEHIDRRFEKVTVLVNCSTPKIANVKFSLLEWDDIAAHLDISVKGAFFLAKYIVPIMERARYGKIVNFTTLAIDSPNADWLHYITAKSALQGFSRALAIELAPKGIRVNLVSPGMTDTDLIADIPERTRLVTEARTPLRRLASPEDIAKAVCYLASPASDFLTGETIRINGGQFML